MHPNGLGRIVTMTPGVHQVLGFMIMVAESITIDDLLLPTIVVDEETVIVVDGAFEGDEEVTFVVDVDAVIMAEDGIN